MTREPRSHVRILIYRTQAIRRPLPQQDTYAWLRICMITNSRSKYSHLKMTCCCRYIKFSCISRQIYHDNGRFCKPLIYLFIYLYLRVKGCKIYINNRKFLQGRNSYYMSCFEFVNLSVNPLHSSKYTQWNEVEARVDDFIQNYFILGAFCSQEC